MKHDCQKDISDLYQAGKINAYAKDYLSSICEEGLDDELWEEAIDDMTLATSMGVSSEEDFRLFFYIDHFAEELVDEIFGVKLSEQEEDSLKRFMFNKRNDVNFDNLTSFRVAILQWLKSHDKLEKGAYIGSAVRSTGTAPYYLKRYSMETWVNLVSMVNKLIALGSDRKQALKETAANINDPIERLDFLAWYSFKFGSNKKLYDINKDIQKGSEGTMTNKKVDKFAGIYEDALSYYVPKEVFKKEQNANDYTPVTEESAMAELKKKEDERIRMEELEMARAKLLSRTFAIDKLLQKHHNTLGADQIDALEDALNALRKQVRKLSLASTIDDCVIRTASIMDSHGFEEGGTMLRKLADKHGGGPDLSNKEELNHLLDKLTEISTFLKQRSIVRDIAETDLKLYNMELASLFPELTEASSKLIEAYTYASNKIDDLIPKLRGSVEKAKKDKPKDNKEDIPLKVDKKDKKKKDLGEKEERVPLDFPKEKDLKVLEKEPKIKLDDLSPDEPKPKALIDLEKAIGD